MLAAACGLARPRPPAAPPLRVGTSGDYPPFSVRAADGAVAGFDVEVARLYAHDRGRALELVSFRWPELGVRLAAGEFDVAMSGVTVRGDRLASGTMTRTVARTDALLLTRSVGAPDLASLDQPSRRVAVNHGGHLEQIARARLPHATIVPVDDNRSLPGLLKVTEAGIDAIVTDDLEAATFDQGDFTVAAVLAHDRKAYWVAPARAALAADLDAWLGARERDGTLSRLRLRLLHVDTPSPLPAAALRVVDLASRRLLLMPLVAAAKRVAQLALVDAVREAAVVDRAAARAATLGLDPAAVRQLAQAEILAARAIQSAAAPVEGTAPPLAALRSAIDGVDEALLHALAEGRGVAATPQALAAALRADTDLPGFDDAHAATLGTTLAAVLAPAP